MNRIVIAFFAVVTSLALCRAETFKAATEYPATTLPGEGLTRFARLVSERSGGALTVETLFEGPQGLRSKSMVEAVRDGRLDIADAFGGSIGSLDTRLQLASLPFLATSAEAAWRLYQSALPSYRHAFVQLGQKLLYTTPWPPSGIWSAGQLASVSDLRALSIRTYDAAGTGVFRAAGAEAFELSFADTMPRLADRTLNAVLSSGDGGAGRKLWQFLPYFCEIGYAIPLSFTTISLKAYDALAPEMKALIEKAAADNEEAQWAALATRSERNFATMRDNGVTINKPSGEMARELARAAESTLKAWETAAGAEAGDILRRYRDGAR